MSTSTKTVTVTNESGATTTTTTTVTAPAASGAPSSLTPADSFTWGGQTRSWQARVPIEKLRPVLRFDALGQWAKMGFERVECEGNAAGALRTAYRDGVPLPYRCTAVFENGYECTPEYDASATFRTQPGSVRISVLAYPISDTACTVAMTVTYLSADHETTEKLSEGVFDAFGQCVEHFSGTLNASVVLSEFHSSLADASPALAMTMDDINESWLSNVFGTEVVSFDKEVCGGGSLGYTMVLRNIKLKDASVSRPSSVAVKIHVGIGEVRGLAVATHSYSREVWFYTHGRKVSPTKAPKALYIVTDGTKAVDYFNLVMEDLTVEWEPVTDFGASGQTAAEFLNLLKTQVIPQQAKFWEKYDFIAQEPLSMHGTRFNNLYGLPSMIDGMAQTLPVLRENLLKLCFPELKTLPAGLQKYLTFMEKLAVDDQRLMRKLTSESVRIMSTRPQTMCHGDLNSSNLWKNKADPTQTLLCDWQITRMAPAAFETFNPLVFLDTSATENGGAKTILIEFHKELCRQQPAAKKSYPIEHVYADTAMVAFTMMPFILAIFTSQVFSDMLQEKKDFLFQKFWRTGWSNVANVAEGIDFYTIIDKICEGKYTDLGPRKE